MNRVTPIFFIPRILGRKENKVIILTKSKFLSLQAVNQVFYSIFLDNNDGVVEVRIRKMDSYLGI